MIHQINVVPQDGHWAVRVSGAPDPSSLHPTRQEAIALARALAQDSGIDLVIHRPDGSTCKRISHEAPAPGYAKERPSFPDLARHLAWTLLATAAASAFALYLGKLSPAGTRRLFH